jgi:hypothetical protein
VKNNIKSLTVLLVLLVVFTACGGGGGGGAAAPGNSGGPTTGTFTKTVALTSTTTYQIGPFNDNAFHHYQMLFKPGDVGGSGNITSLSFRLDALSAGIGATCPNVTIKLGHTSVANLGTDMTLNINQGKGSAVTVLNNTTVVVPVGAAGDYFAIPLTIPFNYNGVDNLVVDVLGTAACTADVALTAGQGTSAYLAVAFSSDSGAPNTGSTSASLHHMKFNFAGGNDIVSGSGGSRYAPFTSSAPDQKVQLLYGKNEINGSGNITGIAFTVAGSPTTAQTYKMNVKLGHTNLSALTTTFANNFNVDTPATVASAVSFVVPAGVPVGGYVWIPLPDASFNYNGTNNLIVEIEVTAATGDTAPRGIDWSGISSSTRLYAAAGASTGTVDDSHYGIKFRFAGGTVDVITAGDSSDSFPFSAGANKRQFLYRTAELGAKGSITKVACRIWSDSITSDYNSFTVVLGHTENTALAVTPSSFSGNMTGAQTVFSGTMTVPSTLKAGDWIEIPLSTPFAYDGTRNLVVQMSSFHGAALNNLRISTNGTLYLNRRAFATDNLTDSVTGTGNFLGDLRLFIQ